MTRVIVLITTQSGAVQSLLKELALITANVSFICISNALAGIGYDFPSITIIPETLFTLSSPALSLFLGMYNDLEFLYSYMPEDFIF